MKKYEVSKNGKLENVADAFSEIYSVELLMKEKPVILENELLKNIQKYFKNVKVTSNRDNNISFAFMDYILEYKNVNAPVGIVISIIEEKPEINKLRKSLGQSFNYVNKEEFEKCNVRILVTDIMAIGLNYAKRIELFQKTLYSIVELIPCEGIHFNITEQVISREEYLKNNPLNDDYDVLLGILNVRLFNIENNENEYVMDTLGLSAVGLCDLQCHFKNLDPDEISNILYSYGYYIFENSDVLEEIETIEGITENSKWKCRHEVALVEPERVVLDINPEEDFSCGYRN
ncbi:DUF4261 domain-containing protein [Clostridium beijerinckii]|uniref:DUF4261 domain-containing protein n=1 Tax=Clostridium beijerinckii TaxID=1520 RepID=A0AAE5LSI7_CLOBE|nr:DUF4261 domain-containing protein [Clostridium beijerinckii]NSB16805.1 hypothetical protein [Clostridium beijerinckii]OOM31412.1 hypothetical protein CLOBE_11270 [Clostridium beijerinckii]